MKPSKILLFSLVFSFLITANALSASLFISLYDDSEFIVTLGNTNFNEPVKQAEFQNISGGSYYLKVTRKQASGTSGVIYNGYVKIPDNYSIYSVIDESKNFVIYKKVSGTGSNYDNCNCNCEFCRNCKNNHHDDEWSSYDCGYNVMSSRDFNDLKKMINDRSFESTKIDFAKSGIDQNYFSTDQVRELLGLFSFESTKLDLAKYAYSKTCDKNNFFKLYDIFAFESNVTDLNNFIKKSK